MSGRVSWDSVPLDQHSMWTAKVSPMAGRTPLLRTATVPWLSQGSRRASVEETRRGIAGWLRLPSADSPSRGGTSSAMEKSSIPSATSTRSSSLLLPCRKPVGFMAKGHHTCNRKQGSLLRHRRVGPRPVSPSSQFSRQPPREAPNALPPPARPRTPLAQPTLKVSHAGRQPEEAQVASGTERVFCPFHWVASILLFGEGEKSHTRHHHFPSRGPPLSRVPVPRGDF